MVNVDVDELTTQAQEELIRSTYITAYEDWTRLSSDVDCWIDPNKRLPMLTARLRYQEAKLAYIRLLRSDAASSGTKQHR